MILGSDAYGFHALKRVSAPRMSIGIRNVEQGVPWRVHQVELPALRVDL